MNLKLTKNIGKELNPVGQVCFFIANKFREIQSQL